MVKWRRVRWVILVAGCFATLHPGSARGQGLILGGSGAMYRSMAGASTATAVEALGALYWNPAVISSLPGSEVVIGGELIVPDTPRSGSRSRSGPSSPCP